VSPRVFTRVLASLTLPGPRRIVARMHWGMRRSLLAVLFAVVLLSPRAATAAVIPSEQDLLSVVPGAASFEHRIRPLDSYRLTDAAGHDIGTAFVTSSVPPEIRGYGGEIDVLVGIDIEGRIVGIKLLGHHETPELVQRILDAGFLSNFLGKRADDVGQIETVSGATISSQAILDDVRTSVQTIAATLAGTPPAIGGGSLLRWIPFVAVALLIGLACAATVLPARRRLRTATLALSVAVVGVWLNTPITIGDIVDVRNLTLFWPGKAVLLLLLGFAVAAALLRGNLYCSYLCPYGALQEGVANLTTHKCRPDPRAVQSATWLRWIVAIVTIFAIARESSYAFRTIEPFALCFMRPPELVALVQGGAVLLAALAVRRIWCRFFCPTGLVLDLVALFGAKLRRSAKRGLGIGR
jgi:NosR/NirI family transcriptional regulator, nitrous oxide reductase regulator